MVLKLKTAQFRILTRSFTPESPPETLEELRDIALALHRLDAIHRYAYAKLGDEMGGHVVSGHVDGLGRVISITPEGGSHRIEVEAPAPLHRYIAAKGSITVDGVSLTVNAVEGQVFSLNIIPHTWDVTTLGRLKVGDSVNLEIDMLARYLARWQETA